MLTGYIGYYVLGHYIHDFVDDEWINKYKKILIVSYVMCMVIVIATCGIDSVSKGQPSSILNTPLSIFHIVSCFAIFSLSKVNIVNGEKRICVICKKLSKYTFGVYLIHPVFIDIVRRVGLGIIYPHPVVMIPIITMLVSVFSFIFVYILSKIPAIKQIVS